AASPKPWFQGARIGLSLLLAASLQAQVAPPPIVEPGMEQAVKWRWKPEPSDPEAWGFSVEPVAAPGSLDGTGKTVAAPLSPPTETLDYEIQKGDSLYVIAKRYGISVDQ